MKAIPITKSGEKYAKAYNAKQLRADSDFKQLAELLRTIRGNTFFYTMAVANQAEVHHLAVALRKKGFDDELVEEELNKL